MADDDFPIARRRANLYLVARRGAATHAAWRSEGHRRATRAGEYDHCSAMSCVEPYGASGYCKLHLGRITKHSRLTEARFVPQAAVIVLPYPSDAVITTMTNGSATTPPAPAAKYRIAGDPHKSASGAADTTSGWFVPGPPNFASGCLLPVEQLHPTVDPRGPAGTSSGAQLTGYGLGAISPVSLLNRAQRAATTGCSDFDSRSRAATREIQAMGCQESTIEGPSLACSAQERRSRARHPPWRCRLGLAATRDRGSRPWIRDWRLPSRETKTRPSAVWMLLRHLSGEQRHIGEVQGTVLAVSACCGAATPTATLDSALDQRPYARVWGSARARPLSAAEAAIETRCPWARIHSRSAASRGSPGYSDVLTSTARNAVQKQVRCLRPYHAQGFASQLPPRQSGEAHQEGGRDV